jgi:hypothetical protein
MKAFLKYYLKDPLALLRSELQLRFSKQTPVLVFTMAKVGSLSIYSSIKKQTSIPCFHIHTLSLAECEEAKQVCLSQGILPDSRSPVPILLKKIITPKNPYKIISLFRDPVERNISAFFDAFHYYVGVSAEKYEGNIESLIDCFHKKLPHDYATLWVQEKFERDTGIDLYAEKFNTKEGHQLYEYENCHVLLINSVIEDRLKRKLVAKFIGNSSFQLTNVNVTEKSNKSKLYKAFKDQIRFDKNYLDRLLQTKYSRHFFSQEEIENSYKKWLQ